MLVTSSAFADGDSGHGDDGHHLGGGCNSQYKVGLSDSDCLSAWWDNTPPVSTGVVGGSTYGVKNKCSEYGDMQAHIDMLNTVDTHFHLYDGDKTRGRRAFNDVSGIACCANESDLCYEQQVKKKNGKIKVWSGTGTTMNDVDVSTHVKRYLYCDNNPTSVYCVNDPDDDAFIAPTILCGPTNNKRECRAGDCRWTFNRADHEDVGTYCTIDAASYVDGFCTFDTTCTVPDGTAHSQQDFEIFLFHVKSNLEACWNTTDEYYYIVNEDDGCV